MDIKNFNIHDTDSGKYNHGYGNTERNKLDFSGKVHRINRNKKYRKNGDI